MNIRSGAELQPPNQQQGMLTPARRRPHRTWSQRVLLTLGSLASVALLLVSAVIYRGLQHYRAISFLSIDEVQAAPPGEPSNWLLVGSDSRDGIDPDDPNAGIFLGEEAGGKRTDTIMVARVDPGAGTVDLLSIPRDLWVPLAGTGDEGRINSAFNGEGGAERLVTTVEDVLDVEINNYAEVNFVGFQAVVDALGGVPIWFEKPVRDDGSALSIPSPGCHLLGGFEALAFARARHLDEQDEDGEWHRDPTSDLGRNSRQQFLLSRLADRASSQIGLTDLGTVDAIVAAGGENLTINDGTSSADLISLARSFAGVGASGIRSHALPVVDRTVGEAQVLGLVEDDAEDILDIFRGVLPAADPNAFPSDQGADRSSFRVEVLNGAGVEGLAGEASQDLSDLGFLTAEPGNAGELVDDTTVRYPAGSEGAATELGRILAVTPRFELDDTVEDVTLVLGVDYEGVITASVAGITVTSTAPDPAQAPPIDTGSEVVGFVPQPGPEGTDCWFPT